MNAPTARILAFSTPAVNGDLVSVLTNFGASSANLCAPREMMRELATDILAHTGGCGIVAPAITETTRPPTHKRGGAK